MYGCYAEEARDLLVQLVHGKTVELVADATQAYTDVYVRLLRPINQCFIRGITLW